MKYFMVIAGLILVALVVILLIVAGLSGRRSSRTGERQVNIADHIGPEAAYSIRVVGRITAPETHNEIFIRVTQDERRIEIIRGYGAEVVTMETFGNSDESFDEFVRALGGAGFLLTRSFTPEDPRGVCSEGRRFTYNLQSSDRQVIDSWSTSCRSSEGTFSGNSALVQRLFEWQIPNYDELTRGVRL